MSQNEAYDEEEYYDEDDEEMPATERDLADDAQWKLIQKNTFTRWANEHLKTVGKQVLDLETDLSDGLRLISLVEVLSSKKFKHINKKPTFRTQKLENVTMVLRFLEEDEGIRIVNIDSGDIVDQKLKLILGLIWTLILHYSISMPMWEGEEAAPGAGGPTPKQRLLNWIQGKCADLPIHNFTTDWNDGRAIGALVDACGPGLCPDWADWAPKNKLKNAKEAMDAAEKWLDVPQLIKPSEMINPKVDEMSMMTYLSQFPNCKLNPAAPLRPRLNPNRVRAYGPGIEPTGNTKGAKTSFTVETFSAGQGELEVLVLNPKGQKEPCEAVFNNDKYLTYTCSYTPKMEGNYKVIIKYSAKEIPKSPFTVAVSAAAGDPSKVKAAGPGLEPGNIVSKMTYFTISIKDAGEGPVDVVINDPSGNPNAVKPKIQRQPDGSYRVEYTPKVTGVHIISIVFCGQPIPKSPISVTITTASNAKKCYATGRGIQPKGIRVKDKADFKVHTKGAGEADLKVTITGPGNVPEAVNIKKLDATTYGCDYTPHQPGTYTINITYGDQHITKSPFVVEVGPFKLSKIKAYGPGLHGGMVGKPATFVVETHGETGALGFSIEGPSQAKIDCKDNGDGTADITYWPTAPGEYAVHIHCNEEDIPNSPYMAQIVPATKDYDPLKVVASGPGLQETGVQVQQWAEFTVDARKAGKAQLEIICNDADGNPVNVDIKDNGNGTFSCKYKPMKNVKHVVVISYGGVNIPKSPFRVFVQSPSSVKVYGPGVEPGVKTNKETYFVVDCKDAGPGDVAIALTDERGMDVPVNTIDNQDGTFTMKYTAQIPGTYTVNVYFADKEIPTSPIKVKVESSIDIGKVKVEGLEKRVFLDSPADFTVDAAAIDKNGNGKVRAIVSSPSGAKAELPIENHKDGTYSGSYMPLEQGPYTVDISYDNMPVPGSPFQTTAVPGCDPSRVKAYGPGLEHGFTHQPNPFTVESRGAGQSNLGLSIDGPVEAKMTCKDNHDGTCDVEYTPVKAGPYDISVKYADQHIPGSPFHVAVETPLDATKVKCFGPGVDTDKGIRANEPTSFTIDAKEAGEAPLEVSVTDKLGKRPADVMKLEDNVYQASYVVPEEGQCQLDVKYGNQHVPKSPFKMPVKPSYDPSKVRVYGPGIGDVSASLPVSFCIDTSEAGIAELEVSIQRPDGTFIQPIIADNGDGTFTVTYTPEDVGVYTIKIKFGGVDVPNTPIKAQSKPVGDASKCRITKGMERTVMVKKETVITVDASQAGTGKVTCRIHDSNGHDIDIDIIENPDNTFSIQFTPQFPGTYSISIQFGGQSIPEGEYTIEVDDMIRPEQYDQVHAAAPYHPLDFCIPVGPVFNFVSGFIITPSGKKTYPKIEDNKNGTVSVRYQPTEAGLHELHVHYNNEPVYGSPFQFHVDAINSGFVTAHGPGLTHGVVNEPAVFTIVTKDAGAGGLSLSIEGPSKATINCVDNKDGTCTVSYLPTAPGEYCITVKFADKNISGSPFKPKITPGEPRRKAQISVGSSSEVSLKVTETDISNLTAMIKSPSGKEEPCILKKLSNGHLGISFTPHEVGEHLVNVFRNGQHIASSPFKIYVGEGELGNASKVKVSGRGIVEGMANEVNEFTVNTKEAGYGGLSLSIEGPSKADIECKDNDDGTCGVTYKPTEPGTYIINIKFADVHVPGSPFSVKIGGEPSSRITERITRHREAADITHIGSQCELSLKIPGTSPFDMTASVTSPSGVTEVCDVVSLNDCHYSIKFVPKEMGVHTVSVKHKDMHIPGSPFEFTVGPITGGGAHKVHAAGPGLEKGEVLQPCEFNIYTREAGAGGLSIAVEGPSKAEIDFEDRKDGSCGVTYVCSEPGEYLVSVKFNDEHIPDSPFRVAISPSVGDARKLSVSALQEKGLQVNKPAAFKVSFNGARGKLQARVVAPSGAEDEALVHEIDEGEYSVSFIPRENGPHLVHVTFDGCHITGSPFRVLVGKVDADPGKVTASGEGLFKGHTGTVCKFVVSTVNAGSGALAVTVEGPSKVKLDCREVEEGYEFSYTPTAPGDYLITIRYAGVHIAGSPFKAKITGDGHASGFHEQASVVVETVTKTSTTTRFSGIQKFQSDASKVVANGAGLKTAYRGKPNTFTIDTTHAGVNIMFVGMRGPKGPCEELIVKHMGNNQYTISYFVKEQGEYMLIVKWGDEHIPGSPFCVEVQ